MSLLIVNARRVLTYDTINGLTNKVGVAHVPRVLLN